MMLQALVAYADREGLGDLDFENRVADYELRIAPDGAFLGLVDLGEGKRRGEAKRLPVGPTSKNNAGTPSFVVDKAQYVIGTAKSNDEAQQRNAAKSFKSYAALIQSASVNSADAGLTALAAFLTRIDQIDLVRNELAAKEAKPEAREAKVMVPVLMDGDAGTSRIHEREAVASWWMASREAERVKAETGPLARCLVTGVVAPVARIHPMLKGSPFPGTGCKLVAYDKPAFTSQNLDQGDNAPVSEAAARKYTGALNALLARDPEGRRRSAIDLDGDVVVFWTRDKSDAPAFVLDIFNPPKEPGDAAASVSSPWRGRRPDFDPTPFYAVTLGANQARVVVRDWLETTADRIGQNLGRWFDDLQLGEGEPEPVPLGPMLRALQATPEAQHDKRGLPPSLASKLFYAAVFGQPLPRLLLTTALQRMRVPPRDRESRDTLRFRVALIKAVLVRTPNFKKEIPVALDPNNTDRAYLLGRLFAAIEKLQADALGSKVNATLRDRYYGSASTTPAMVFPRLMTLSMHHASKAKKEHGGSRVEKVKSEIVNQLDPSGFPRTLSLEEQGLFAVGYYHQREALYQKAVEPNS